MANMRSQLVTLTSQLIKFRSETNNAAEVSRIINFITDWSRTHGLVVKKYVYNKRPSLAITLSAQKPKLLFNGHIDVVPATPDQYKPVVKKNKLYGRGAQDMKSGVAAMLSVLASLKKEGFTQPIGMLVVADEEIGGFDGSKKLLHLAKYRPEFLIAGESTDLKIEYQAKGITWIKVKAIGKRAHGAYLWEGTNAIRKLADEIRNISKLYPEYRSLIWKTTCNIGKVSGGLAINQVPGVAEADLDIRRVPEETTQDVYTKIKRNLVYKDTQLEIVFDEPAHNTPKDDRLVRLLDQSVRRVTGKKAVYIQKCGASDARHFSAEKIPAVCFGPVGSFLHTDSEFLDIPSLEKYYQILLDFSHAFFLRKTGKIGISDS